MQSNERKFNLSNSLKWWETLSDEQKIYIYVGTASLYAAIRSNDPMKQASIANRLIRARFPSNPGHGEHIRQSRGKLAINFWRTNDTSSHKH